MADPRQVGPKERKANLSPLMEAQQRASKGEKVNVCPFGCTDPELDDNGYCRHVVGFTNDGVTYEPFEMGPHGRRQVRGDKPQPIMPKDKLVRITTSSRVYREVPPDEALTEAQLEALTTPGGTNVR